MENPIGKNRFLLLLIAVLAIGLAGVRVFKKAESPLPGASFAGFEEPLHVPSTQFLVPTAPKWGSFKIATAKKSDSKATATIEQTKTPSLPVASSQAAHGKQAQNKKKKKKTKKTELVTKQESPKTEKEERKKPSGFANSVAQMWNPTQGAAPAQMNPDDPATFQSLEDWEKYLFSNPDYKKGMKLLEAYQSGRLKDPTWFYTLTEKMTQNSSSQVREIGFYLLGATPSFQSFVVLAHNYDQYGPETTEQNEKRLQAYGFQRNMWGVLTGALLSEDPSAQVAASRVIAMTAPYSANSERPRQGRGTTASGSAFSVFIPTLERLARNDPSADVCSNAQRTLQILESISRQLTQL